MNIKKNSNGFLFTKQFQRTPKLGDDEMASKFQLQLETQIDEQFEQLKTNNEKLIVNTP